MTTVLQNQVIAVVLAGLLVNAGAAWADEKLDTLVQQVETATSAVQTLTADVVVNRQDGSGRVKSYQGRVKLKRPNLALFVLEDKTYGDVLASDGTNLWRVASIHKNDTVYDVLPADSRGRNIGPVYDSSLFEVFLDPRLFLKDRLYRGATRSVGTETVEGRLYRTIVTQWSNGTGGGSVTAYIGPDHLPHRLKASRWDCMKQRTVETLFKNPRLNKPLAASEFVYAPPAATRREDHSLSILQP